MKTTVARIACLVFALFAASAATSEAVGTLREISIESRSLKGNLLGDPTEQKVGVYLPPGYDTSTRRYPVVYLLHGIADDYHTWIDNYHVPQILDRLIGSGAIPPVIVVMPNGRNRLLGSFYVDSPVTGRWSEYISGEVVQRIDSDFRTLARPASRAIVGHSMGGFGAIHFAMTSDVFDVAYAISPCCLDAAEDIGWGNGRAWSQALGFKNDDSIKTALDQNDFYPVAIVAFLAATLPDPSAPMRVDFPMRASHGELMPNEPVYSRWRDSLPLHQVALHRDRLRKLHAFRIDAGFGDQFAHIPPSVAAFSAELSSNRVPHVLDVYDGEHHDIGRRLETIIFPFVAKALDASQ